MTTKKENAKKTAAESVKNDYDSKTFGKIARKSGEAIKVSTTKDGGRYKIYESRKQGTPVLLKTILGENFPKARTVPADKVLPILRGAYKGSEAIRLSGLVAKETGKPYGNIGFLRIICKRIEESGILSFRLVSPEEEAKEKEKAAA